MVGVVALFSYSGGARIEFAMVRNLPDYRGKTMPDYRGKTMANASANDCLVIRARAQCDAFQTFILRVLLRMAGKGGCGSSSSTQSSSLALLGTVKKAKIEASLAVDAVVPEVPSGPAWAKGKLLVCKSCRRNGTHANPCPRKHKGVSLCFASFSQCLCCKNYHHGVLAAYITVKELNKKLQDEACHTEYMEGLSGHEKAFDENEMGNMRSVNGVFEAPEFIDKIQEVAADDTTG